MKIWFFLFSLIAFSCSSEEKKTKTMEQDNVQVNTGTDEETEVKLTFEATQDSLRDLLLQSKPNETLKSSLLQELYIRGLVTQENDKIFFELPFNLHGLDCGAPDCYSTYISFKIAYSEPIDFPEQINFELYEHGCIDQQKSINSVFTLKEESIDLINYFSKDLKSNLIIKRNGQLYYYPHLKENSVSVEEVDKMFENNEFDDAEIVPSQSTVMTTNEYDHFIKK